MMASARQTSTSCNADRCFSSSSVNGGLVSGGGAVLLVGTVLGVVLGVQPDEARFETR